MPNYKIEKDNEYMYKIQITGDYRAILYQSIVKQLSSSIYNEDKDAIFVIAETVETLKDYLLEQSRIRISDGNCINMIYFLTNQILFLQNQGYCIYGLDIDDILVINKSIFKICNTAFLLPIQKEHIHFYSPITTPYFYNPKLLELTTLPASIHYKTSYYSLGALTVFCLLNTYLLVGNDRMSDKDIERVLTPYKGTKIYWFIKRCLQDNELLLI
jgi:hypothetical protein